MENRKHVVITGAGSGLGAALAFKYNELGNHVTLIGRTKNKLEEVAKNFSNSNYSIYTLDVSSPSDVERVFNQIVKDVKPIDILVNSAGLGYFDIAENLTNDQINQMIDINLKGTIFSTQQVLPSMKKRNEGSIINIISTAGIEGKVTESVYCASKFGVKGFTESIIKEVSDKDINIHGIYMGGMNTTFWGEELQDENETGLMDPNDVADIIILNTKKRPKVNIPEIIIKNH